MWSVDRADPRGILRSNTEFVELSNRVQGEEARLDSFRLLRPIAARNRGVGKAGNEERTDGVAEMIARIGGVAYEDDDFRWGGGTEVSVTSSAIASSRNAADGLSTGDTRWVQRLSMSFVFTLDVQLTSISGAEGALNCSREDIPIPTRRAPAGQIDLNSRQRRTSSTGTMVHKLGCSMINTRNIDTQVESSRSNILQSSQ